ncbi:hypothetical protein HY629_02755 [Candidatus Uhrbacteria bacterium]|nr:hypothetical protein [Candidatus Uhrbacteria bacterium]
MPTFSRFSLLATIAALLIGGGVGWYVGDRRGHDRGIVDGVQQAKEKLVRLGILETPPQKLNSLSGTITAIDVEKQRLAIRTPQVITNPLETGAPTDRTVLLTRDTALVARKGEKDRAIRVTDLKAGQSIILEHFADFLYQKEFEVAKITVVE